MSDSLEIISLLIMTVMSSFFSLSEASLTASSKGLVSSLATTHPNQAKLALWLINKKDSVIPAILVGNNIAGIFASALATVIAVRTFGEYVLIYSTIVATIIIVVFGEIMPKTYALTRPHNCLVMFCYPILITYRTLRPISSILQMLVNFIINRVSKKQVLSLQHEIEELRYEIYRKFGQSSNKAQMLSGILELTYMTVENVMTHRDNVIYINECIDSRELYRFISTTQHSRVPVINHKKDEVIGVLNIKAAMRNFIGASENDICTNKVFKHASFKTPWFVLPQTPLLKQLELFKSKRKQMSIVVDEYGNFVGIVTLEDVLETFVGDIFYEEDEVSNADISHIRDAYFEMSGSAKIDAINIAMDILIPTSHLYSTISGFIILHIKRIPREGSVVYCDNVKIKVVQMKHGFISRVSITKIFNR